ncbi:MAG: ribosome maturation factor RimM [Acidobacteria bacterium]|nr:ribosome maturation factor RimM [Acidobacteriota bacterium]MCA1637816.1 ribosome maturation factor RimM [Acidobacteriota bacterium]
MNEELVAIAKTAKTRGLRGELVADILTDFPERFDGLKKVFAVKSNGEISVLKIENYWFQKNRVVLKFKDFDSIEKAETLRDCEICIPESEAVELEEGEFFDWELEGCAVETVEGEKIGKVKEVLRTGGTEILVVEGAEKECLIPFAESICVEVDVENKLIKIDVPEGLLEF